ncbi:MAG: 1-deoxy-D-xylulose 5-phosphate reductoisomerase [Chlamydiae bacterium]|nr:1-deoxy-D-xylulose 5-phosphate reductoisomerase [Chlamydiota bacterium]
MHKKIAILGSTGSIGRSALQVVRHLQRELKVVTLAAKSNIDLLEEQAKEFHPELIAVWDHEKALELQKRIPHIPVLGGQEGVVAASTHASVDLLLSAISGFDGVLPTLKAIEAKKDIALANKEALVSAGKLVTRLAEEHGVQLIPVDSEHTALFQCLNGENRQSVRRMILTASGGPFLKYTSSQLEHVGRDEALKHPNYRMGAKVTIDSSTLMNKGLEIIEAHFLYDMPLDQIEVIVHPEQVIHSMVEFVDGAIMAQMGVPDMLVPIQYALTYPERKEGILEPFDFSQYSALHFAKADTVRFRCLELAYDSLRVGGSMPCFMNAANEVLVQRFLEHRIGWIDIGQKLEALMEKHTIMTPTNYDELVSVDREARARAQTA